MKDLRPLQHVTKLLHDRDLQALQSIRTEENRLRDELTSLRESLEKRGSRTPSDDRLAYALAGEQQWVVWVDARIRTLNGQLAHVMARKSYLMAAAAKSLGRKTALEQVARKDAEAARQRVNRQHQDRLLEFRLQRQSLADR